MIGRLQEKLRQHWRWIGAGIGILFLVLALHDTDLRAVGRMLAQAQLVWLGLAMFAQLMAFLLTAVRWRILLRARNEPSVLRLTGVLFVAQLLNGVLPGRTGVAARAYLVGSDGPGVTFVLGTVVIEKVFEWLTLLPVAFISLLLAPIPDQVWRSLLVISAILVVFLVLAGCARHYCNTVIRWSLRFTTARAVRQHLRNGLDSLLPLIDRPIALRALSWSLVVWTFTILSYGFMLEALRLDAPFLLTSLSLLVVFQAGVRVPASPGGIGVLHYLAVLTLGWFGVSREAALSYGILLHSLTFLVPGFLGALYLLFSRVQVHRLLPGVRQLTVENEIPGMSAGMSVREP